MTLRVRPLEPRDLGALAAWQDQLCDEARGGGAHVVVAERDAKIVGVAGWVPRPPAFFGSPVVADDQDAAAALVGELIARARQVGAETIRIGCSDEPAKRAALVAAGFELRLHFVTLACAAEARAAAVPDGLTREALDAERLRDLNNETFAGIDNAPPISTAEAAELVSRAWPAGSAMWTTGGRAVAFTVALREGHAVVIDSIGVAADQRGRGIARALVDGAIAAAAADGATEVRALIASTNAASLALHRAAGMREVARREMFELRL